MMKLKGKENKFIELDKKLLMLTKKSKKLEKFLIPWIGGFAAGNLSFG